MVKAALSSALVLAMLVESKAETGSKEKVEKKNITLITAESSADGRTEVRREVVKECLQSLPNPDQIEPQISSEAIFLRDINGETGKNEWVKAYTAKLEVNYFEYQKELLIVSTRSVQASEPIIKEVEKKLKRTEAFVSNPDEGDTYAGRSNRKYYHTKPENAAKDVKSRAKVWIQQQSSVACGDK